MFILESSVLILLAAVLIIIIVGISLGLLFTGSISFIFCSLFCDASGNILGENIISAFVGISTIILAVIAYMQTIRANFLSRNMLMLQQATFYSMISIKRISISVNRHYTPGFINPKFDIVETFDLKKPDVNIFQYIYIDTEIANDSDYAIGQLSIYDGFTNMVRKVDYMNEIIRKDTYIPPHGSTTIRIIVPNDPFSKTAEKGVKLRLYFINVFDYQTKSILTIKGESGMSGVTSHSFSILKVNDIKPEL